MNIDLDGIVADAIAEAGFEPRPALVNLIAPRAALPLMMLDPPVSAERARALVDSILPDIIQTVMNELAQELTRERRSATIH